jgi:hypothetical protein
MEGPRAGPNTLRIQPLFSDYKFPCDSALIQVEILQFKVNSENPLTPAMEPLTKRIPVERFKVNVFADVKKWGWLRPLALPMTCNGLF